MRTNPFVRDCVLGMMCFPQAIGHRERWDNEIEADSTHGKLELGVYEAFEEKAKGALRDL